MKNILIVEDDRILLKRITTALEKYADTINVVPAKDGKEGLDVLKQTPISLVVTDIQLPRINGMMLLAYVYTYYPAIPCIAMTSYGTSRLRAKLPKETLRFFQKPFDVEDLVQAIVATLERDQPIKDEQGISVVSFLDMIQMEKVSCIFEIRSPHKPPGKMYFEKGVLLDASCADMTGEAAALELIAREISTYRFKPFTEKGFPRKIKTDLRELIRNAVVVDFENELPME